jgi:S-adenosylmethionine hydrolase
VKSNGIVTMLTDFGEREPYVGVMEGVMLGIAPYLKLVSLTHQVRPQAVREAAFWVARVRPWFAPGTVHLAVVDPGVGSERRPICLRTNRELLVGPDNGIFSEVLATEAGVEVREIDVAALGTRPSRTFHGRDIFAPVAARLASGQCTFEELGPTLKSPTTLFLATPFRQGSALVGEVVTLDHFGNLLTNIAESPETRSLGEASVGGRQLRVVATYAEAGSGECVALFGSFGTLEIAVRDGSAAELLSLGPGAPVSLL